MNPIAVADDRILDAWATLAAVPILGAICLAMVYFGYRIALAWIEQKRKDR